MKSLPIVSLLASVVVAQSSSSSPKTSSSSGAISQGCQNFLNELDKDSSLASCAKFLTSATSAFSPGGNSNSPPSKDSVTSSLKTLCASSSSCDESNVKSKLAAVFSACSTELTSSNRNQDVLRNYDVLYTLLPFKNAVCAKNDNGDYCVQQASAPNAPTSLRTPDYVQKYLAQDVDGGLVPNTTTFETSNLPYLFLKPSASSEVLCTTCSRNIMTSYINFQSDVPYAPGIASSPMMQGQPDLYNAITDKCGKNFLSGVVQAAGGLAGNGPLGGSKSGTVKSMNSFGASSLVIALGVLVGSFIL